MENIPTKFSIEEIISKAEEFYKNPEIWTAPATYEASLEEMKQKIFKIQNIAKEDFKKDMSIADVIYTAIKAERDIVSIHISILVGFRMEQEKQKEKENKQDLEAIVRLVLEQLAFFSLPPGSKVTVMSMEEVEEAIRKNNIEINKSLLKLFFMNGWIYYPLSLPFVILKIIWFICVVIKPATKEVKNLDMSEVKDMSDINFKKLNFKSIIEGAEKRMPKIMDIEYFGHHIVCGILMWIIILKWIF